jgi:hypothetical protein
VVGDVAVHSALASSQSAGSCHFGVDDSSAGILVGSSYAMDRSSPADSGNVVRGCRDSVQQFGERAGRGIHRLVQGGMRNALI